MSKGKLIKVCGECANYDWKKHRCKLGCNEGEPQEPFFTDCPLPTVDTKPTEWISVDERLPEDDLSEEHNKKTIKVLVAIKAKNGITIRTQERFRDYTYSNVGDPITFWTWRFSHGKVTHWMPLPEPPMMKGGAE